MKTKHETYRIKNFIYAILLISLCVVSFTCKKSAPANQKKIVFIAGPGSHGYGNHEHYAGSLLLAKCLNENVPGLRAEVCKDGWPKDPSILEDADAIVVYSDGGSEHPIGSHFPDIDQFAKKGVGIAFLHFSIIVDKGQPGDYLLDWIGGYFEPHWSVNPYWEANFESFPEHPITRGVKPFRILDEWYFHMRFAEDMKGVTPLLTATPPKRAFEQEEGPYTGNQYVRERVGMPDHLAWAYVRPDGSRGFGFTGGHMQWNWAHNQYRKFILNALVWTIGMEVPPDGVPSAEPTLEELTLHQDFPQPDSWGERYIRKWIEDWNRPETEQPSNSTRG